MIIFLSLCPIVVENLDICFKFIFLLMYKDKIQMIKYTKYINKISTDVLIDKLNNVELSKKNKDLIVTNLIVRYLEKKNIN